MVTSFKEDVKVVEEIMEQLRAVYPQYRNDNIECFTGWYCQKSIGYYTGIIIATFVDYYVIILQNSIDNKKVEIHKDKIDFDFIYKLTESFKVREKDLEL